MPEIKYLKRMLKKFFIFYINETNWSVSGQSILMKLVTRVIRLKIKKIRYCVSGNSLQFTATEENISEVISMYRNSSKEQKHST